MLDSVAELEKHVRHLRNTIIISTLSLIASSAVIFIIYILTFSNMYSTLGLSNDQLRLLSERLDRNYYKIEALREATATRCKEDYGKDLKSLQEPKK